MRTVTRPRGRLPARVYWFRRSMVLLTALALVFAIGRLLSSGGGTAGAGDTAAVTASSPTTTATPAVAGPLPIQPTGQAKQPAPSATGTPVVLAVPDGPCAVDEVTVTPSVPVAVAGGRVDIVLELTGIKPACTFTVSNSTLVAKVTSGTDRVWTSQDCPASIKTASVVVRSAEPTKVVVPWSGRRSDDQCSRETPWALPGYYHVAAAAIGSEPGDAQFRLSSPPRPVVTKTAKPHAKKKASSGGATGKGTVYGGDNAGPAD